MPTTSPGYSLLQGITATVLIPAVLENVNTPNITGRHYACRLLHSPDVQYLNAQPKLPHLLDMAFVMEADLAGQGVQYTLPAHRLIP